MAHPRGVPHTPTVWAAEAMVASVDHLASSAGLRALEQGGSAVDAAIAANAVLTITSQHMCGLGGDLWALVSTDGGVACLNASGRAGSGADPERLRAAGHTTMPHRDEVGSAPVPGVVDGWLALHERHGRLSFADLIAPAIDIAERGFAASSQLAASSANVASVAGNTALAGVAAGEIVRRPRVARNLRALVAEGREGWYGGEFGEALIDLGAGEYTAADLAESQADWVEPAALDAWGHRLWTAPPNSQGYLSVAGAWIASGLDLPDDPTDPLFAHLLIESARAAAYDRPDALHEHAEWAALLSPQNLGPRRDRIRPDGIVDWGDRHAGGGTMYLCVVDGDGMGVSLIQSNANGFGCHLMVGDTGVFLHNRGIGFNLEAGHPAEYGPGRRPPHTLSPALITHADGSLRSVLGTMGGDAQPQVVLQMMARMLHLGERPGSILSAPRFALASPEPMSGFDTWSAGGDVRVRLEPHAPWESALRDLGHRVEMATVAEMSGFGHAHLIEVRDTGALAGAADPRAFASAALGR
ncbi:MAG: gamma-glutamyltransferase [Actinomycetota bacterium]